MVAPRRRPPQRKNAKPVLPMLVLGMILVAGGAVIGWLGRSYLQPLPGGIGAADNTDQQVCPQPVTATETWPVSAQPVSGEGVIEFRFYRPGEEGPSRKWVTRIPLSGGAPEIFHENSPPGSKNDQNNKAEPKVSDQIAEVISNAEKKTAPEPKAVKKEKKPEPVPAKAVKKDKKVEKKQSEEKTGFTVQISSHDQRIAAEHQVGKLEMAGFDGRIEKAEVPGKGIYYRVRIGKQLNRRRAEAILKGVKRQLNIDGYLIAE